MSALPVAGPVPPGAILSYLVKAGAKPIAPMGWMVCDGRSTDGTYLDNLLGGLTPNLIGRTLVGAGSLRDEDNKNTDDKTDTAHPFSGKMEWPLWQYGGAVVHKLTDKQMPVHKHGLYFGQAGWGVHPYGQDTHAMVENAGNTKSTDEAGIGEAHNNLQPFFASVFIIYTGNPNYQDKR